MLPATNSAICRHWCRWWYWWYWTSQCRDYLRKGQEALPVAIRVRNKYVSLRNVQIICVDGKLSCRRRAMSVFEILSIVKQLNEKSYLTRLAKCDW